MNKYVLAYSIYLIVTTLLTIWVGRVLFKNGRVFLRDIFHGNLELADAVDKLLLAGFYLINIGYAVYSMMVTTSIEDYRMLMEVLSRKIGYIILLLGAVHFLNMFVLFRMRKREQYNL